MPATPKTNARNSGNANALTSAGSTVASGPNTRIMMASIISPNASMPASTEGLNTLNARSAIPKISATTNVLRTPSVRLLIPRAASTTRPTTKSVPGVFWNAAGSKDADAACSSGAAGASRLPARYSSRRRAASLRRMSDVSGNPTSP